VNPFGAFRAAIAFLTRIPVGKTTLSASDIAWAPALFPLVGAMLGAASYLLLCALQGFGAWGSAIVVTAFHVYVTGAFHEDGLADTADALGGCVPKERALEIFKDSRIGSYGTCALVLSLLLRVTLLARLGTDSLVPLLVYGSLARVSPLFLMTHLSHANPTQGKLKDLQRVGKSRAYLGLFLAVALGVGVSLYEPGSELRLLLAFVVTAFTCLWFARLARRRLGGIVGDILGAAEQLAELSILLVFAWQPA
jgi:adenosylcobinamide-GDP ribazoletransferase